MGYSMLRKLAGKLGGVLRKMELPYYFPYIKSNVFLPPDFI
jgi:hypothetical protein